MPHAVVGVVAEPAVRAARAVLPDHGGNYDNVASLGAWNDLVTNDELTDILVLLNEKMDDMGWAEAVRFIEAIRFIGYDAREMLKEMVRTYHVYMAIQDNVNAVDGTYLASFQGSVFAVVLLTMARGGNIDKIAQRASEEGRVLIGRLKTMFAIRASAAEAGTKGVTLFRVASLFPHLCLFAFLDQPSLMQLPRSICNLNRIPKAFAAMVVPGMITALASEDDITLDIDGHEHRVEVRRVASFLRDICKFLSGMSTIYLSRKMRRPTPDAMERSIKGLTGAVNSADCPFRAIVYTFLCKMNGYGMASPMINIIKNTSGDGARVAYYLVFSNEGEQLYNQFVDQATRTDLGAEVRTFHDWEEIGSVGNWPAYENIPTIAGGVTARIQIQ